jgi:hypothetical protein
MPDRQRHQPAKPGRRLDEEGEQLAKMPSGEAVLHEAPSCKPRAGQLHRLERAGHGTGARCGNRATTSAIAPPEQRPGDGSRNVVAMTATAWMLDVAHRVRRVDCEVPAGMRALEAVERAVVRELGVTPFVPLGVRAVEAAPEFLYLVPGGGVRKDFLPLGELARSDERGFAFYIEAMLGGWVPPTHDLDVFYFGDTDRRSEIFMRRRLSRGRSWRPAR